MIFSSYGFIFIFFPVVFTGYWLLQYFSSNLAAKWWLIFASLVFYSLGNLTFTPILMLTVIFNYFIAHGVIQAREKKNETLPKLLLFLSFIENLGLLFYFKYFNFFLGNVNFVFGSDLPFRDIILPLGISFYTFQILSYVIEVYRGKTGNFTLTEFATFVTFFPQLIVGPVVRHNEMLPQLRDESLRRLNKNNIMLGILLFSIGCAKKIILADPMIGFAQNFYNVLGSGNFFESWGAVFSYTFAYYFDFSGYIDMALGLGLFFNIKLPKNFDSPYKARNFSDFWQRWNITVSKFFEDYIFNSIFHFGNGFGKLVLATMATFLVSGIWHGAGWHFIFWGLANGILVFCSYLMRLGGKRMPFLCAWALTFFFILLTRVLFDANNMTQAVTVFKSMFDLSQLFSDPGAFLAMGIDYFKENDLITALIAVGAGICFFAKNSNEISEKFSPKWQYAVFAGILLTISLFRMTAVSQFLYFQF